MASHECVRRPMLLNLTHARERPETAYNTTSGRCSTDRLRSCSCLAAAAGDDSVVLLGGRRAVTNGGARGARRRAPSPARPRPRQRQSSWRSTRRTKAFDRTRTGC